MSLNLDQFSFSDSLPPGATINSYHKTKGTRSAVGGGDGGNDASSSHIIVQSPHELKTYVNTMMSVTKCWRRSESRWRRRGGLASLKRSFGHIGSCG